MGSLLGKRPTSLLKRKLYEEELIHRCDVETFNVTGTDGFGQPTGSWIVGLGSAGILCRLNWKQADEKVWQFEGVIADYKLFVLNTATVPETSQITNIKDEDGNLVDAGPFSIISRQRFDTEEYHHQELYLKRETRAGQGL